MTTHVEHPFPPVISSDSRILILGSFPSVKSREEGFFYGHPRNRFWPMLAAVFAEPIPLNIPDKTALILRHNLALWDVLFSCTITGSSDASIRDACSIDIASLTQQANIQRIICNGATSGRLYERYLQHITGLPALVLPSTSPANAAWSLQRLIEAWRGALCKP